jgi:hypothetical protein
VKEWVEIGNLMFQFRDRTVIVRAVIFGDRSDVFRGGDFVLYTDDAHKLYKLLKQMFENINAEKSCVHCIHYKLYKCVHPGGENIGAECEKTGKQYYEPKYRI